MTTTTTTPPPTTTTAPADPYENVPTNVDRTPWVLDNGGSPRSSVGEMSGGMGINCGHSHLGYNDPIVFPGVNGASHLHNFFGNTATDADSTYASLRATGSGSCFGGPLDRTGYWIPAMHNAAGRVVVPSFLEVYYLGSGATAAEFARIQTYPNGLRMIAGHDMANPGAESRILWECLEPNQAANHGPRAGTIPADCPTGYDVRVSVRFPMCWDGRNVDSGDHRRHMTYGTGGGGFLDADGCPASHPIHVPDIKLFANYVSDGNTANWYLASDRMPGMTHASGSTFHADWFGAWDNEVQEMWTQECVREMRHCTFGQLGDGTRLRDFTGTYAGPSVVDAPPRP